MYLIHPTHPNASCQLSALLASMLMRYNPANRPVIFICIGTPKIPSDCLGPNVGSLLSQTLCSGVYGTLNAPIHALNYESFSIQIKKLRPLPFIITIDAALGSPGNAGMIALKKGPLLPGKGLGKPLSPIGDLQITGIFSDLFDIHADSYLRLFSDCISRGILELYPSFQCTQ